MAAKLTFLLSALASAEDWADATILLQSRQMSIKRDSLVSELSQQMEATAIAVEHGDTLANALTIRSRLDHELSQMKDLPSGVLDSFEKSPEFKTLFNSLPESERQSLLQTVGSEVDLDRSVGGKKPAPAPPRRRAPVRRRRTTTTTTTTTTPIPTPNPAVPNKWHKGAFNYALGMTPVVSSSCHENTGKAPKYLTDGDSKAKGNKAYYHSCETDKNPTITIPLNFLRTAHVGIAVGDVKIQNRCDCCGDRLAGFSVFAGTKLCGTIPAGTKDCGTYTVNCGDEVATEVSVKKPNGNANIVEIEVFGSPVTTPKIFTR